MSITCSCRMILGLPHCVSLLLTMVLARCRRCTVRSRSSCDDVCDNKSNVHDPGPSDGHAYVSKNSARAFPSVSLIIDSPKCGIRGCMSLAWIDRCTNASPFDSSASYSRIAFWFWKIRNKPPNMTHIPPKAPPTILIFIVSAPNNNLVGESSFLVLSTNKKITVSLHSWLYDFLS